MDEQQDPPWQTRPIERAAVDSIMQLASVDQFCGAIHVLCARLDGFDQRGRDANPGE